jgi:hypothetical protein
MGEGGIISTFLKASFKIYKFGVFFLDDSVDIATILIFEQHQQSKTQKIWLSKVMLT